MLQRVPPPASAGSLQCAHLQCFPRLRGAMPLSHVASSGKEQAQKFCPRDSVLEIQPSPSSPNPCLCLHGLVPQASASRGALLRRASHAQAEFLWRRETPDLKSGPRQPEPRLS